MDLGEAWGTCELARTRCPGGLGNMRPSQQWLCRWGQSHTPSCCLGRCKEGHWRQFQWNSRLATGPEWGRKHKVPLCPFSKGKKSLHFYSRVTSLWLQETEPARTGSVSVWLLTVPTAVPLWGRRDGGLLPVSWILEDTSSPSRCSQALVWDYQVT